MYTELQVTSNFSFLRGASHPEELITQAAALGHSSIAITDRNTLAGVVRAHSAAKKHDMRVIIGSRLDLLDGSSLLAFPTDRQAYARLSALLTLGNLRTEKGKCDLYKSDVYAHAKGIKFVVIPPVTLGARFDFDPAFTTELTQYRDALGSELSIAATRSYNGLDAKFLHRIHEHAGKLSIPVVATNDVHYHDPHRRELQDIMTCAREKCTIQNAGYRLYPNKERHLKSTEEMLRLFRQYPDAIRQTQVIAEACTFSLSEIKYKYPRELTPEGMTPQEYLAQLSWEGAKEMFNGTIPDRIFHNIEHELKFIGQVNYAEYFLTVHDIVRFARSRKILCQGRGSAANSTVCYCLGITSVDPSKFDLLFERFISAARAEPPDIDVDFEHERREEVMQYIFQKYGRDHAAIVATVTQLHHKGAINDVGRAFGLSRDTIGALSGLIWDFNDEGFDRARIVAQGINPDDPVVKKVLQLTAQYIGTPRQLGQHTGGFVITDGKISDLCPVFNARMENRTNIEWNKDDIEALGFLKIDVLALGMLTCIRKGFDLALQHYGKSYTLANIPQDDPRVYAMCSAADTIGVFQIESRAQQSMLPRLRPNCFYDLVIQVAIVRPGPIQGDMVHPYLRRRNGEEKVTYPSKELEEILGRTLGVPLFQEQAMKIAIVAAGFTPAEADELRRSMATFKAHGKVKYFEEKLIKGMIKKGYDEEYAKRVFRQLEGFGSYGFPESHAASFALLVYVSAWMKCYYPDVFGCAILNSLPMGFYQPAQLITDARNHGVDVRPIDVNHSDWDYTLEELSGKYYALRIGFRQISGMREEDAKQLVGARGDGYNSMQQLRGAGLTDAALEKLADADAFHSMGFDRRTALWHVSTKDYQPHAIFSDQQVVDTNEEKVELPPMRESEHVIQDYVATSVTLRNHPVKFVRYQLKQLGVKTTAELCDMKNGDPVKVAGLVLVRQRPGTAKGVCFMTIEDETGVANLVIWPGKFDLYRKEIIRSRLFMANGTVQMKDNVIHVVLESCSNLSALLGNLAAGEDQEFDIKRSRADETTSPFLDKKDTSVGVQQDIFHAGRNFH